MQQIADRCGVSRPTVHYVLGNKAHLFTRETADKVLKAAEELGYRRNSSARAMRTGKFACVALLLGPSTELGAFPAGLLTGCERRLASSGMHLAIARCPAQPRGDSVPTILSEAMADGLLLEAAWDLPDEILTLVSASRLPVVTIGARLELNAVYADEHRAAREVTQRLIDLGHRRIAFVGPTHWSTFAARSRLAGYRDAMLDAGLDVQAVGCRLTTPRDLGGVLADAAEHQAFLRQWLTGKTTQGVPTAVVTFDRHEALAVQTVALRAGISVPRKLSIVTFDDYVVNFSGQAISGMKIGTHRLGEMATEMLLRRIERPGEELPAVAVPYEFLEGQTVAVPHVSPGGGRLGSSASRTGEKLRHVAAR
jgi:LacI family transcriptional regulator